ncbi:MAG TPA: beta/gamma crystallin-related protein [Casimicrobiaceae bacterium]|nr:beta/gamma crystallin-related protein [Casimicrobiaceae bacterium]
MKTTLKAALVTAAVLAAGQAAAQLTLYGQEGLRGRAFVVNDTVANFEQSGFNDRASSVIVERGRWEACEDANFRGRCVILRRGQYPSLAALGLNDRISSVRRVRGNPNYNEPPPVSGPTYGFYQRQGERLYEADVVAVREVLGPPEQRCWVERREVVGDRGSPNVPGAIIGGVIGGVLGHQIGSGRGQDVATALGAVGGAAVGAQTGSRGGRVYAQDVQRCASAPGSAQPAYWDVTYQFRGQQHRAQLSAPPGRSITVNERGEPRM